jgi:HAD superfamily phosphatase (TIGR01668 family)
VHLISPQELYRSGIRYMLLDIDNTIVARGTTHIDAAAAKWISEIRALGIRICLLSNNWHKAVLGYAAELDLPIIYKAVKPLPAAFLKARRIIGALSAQTVVIGDQLLTDVVGGGLLGMRTILVKPLVVRDLWHTLLLRRLERLLLADLQVEDTGAAEVRR